MKALLLVFVGLVLVACATTTPVPIEARAAGPPALAPIKTSNDCDTSPKPKPPSTSALMIRFEDGVDSSSGDRQVTLTLESPINLWIDQAAFETPELITAGAISTLTLRGFDTPSISGILKGPAGEVLGETELDWTGVLAPYETRSRVTAELVSSSSVLLHVDCFGKAVSFRLSDAGSARGLAETTCTLEPVDHTGRHVLLFVYEVENNETADLADDVLVVGVEASGLTGFSLGHSAFAHGIAGARRYDIDLRTDLCELRLDLADSRLHLTAQANGGSLDRCVPLDVTGTYDEGSNVPVLRQYPIRSKRGNEPIDVTALTVEWRGRHVLFEVSRLH